MSELTGDWSKVSNILNPAKLRAALTKSAARVGNYGASQVKKGIISGAPGGKTFAPLSQFTIERKRSSKPLIDHGDLVGSVTYQVFDNAKSVFVGVKKGKEVNIAAVHEFGCTIPVTPKMRAYLHHQGIHLKTTTQYINIPARPYIRPVLYNDEFQNKVREIYAQAIQEAFAI